MSNSTPFVQWYRTTESLSVRGVPLELAEFRDHREEAMLVLTLAGDCVPRDEVLARYAPLQIANVPHGHSPHEQTVLSHLTPWGSLDFGFAETARTCLRTLAVRVRK
jgi:hypothetical protein